MCAVPHVNVCEELGVMFTVLHCMAQRPGR